VAARIFAVLSVGLPSAFEKQGAVLGGRKKPGLMALTLIPTPRKMDREPLGKVAHRRLRAGVRGYLGKGREGVHGGIFTITPPSSFALRGCVGMSVPRKLVVEHKPDVLALRSKKVFTSESRSPARSIPNPWSRGGCSPPAPMRVCRRRQNPPGPERQPLSSCRIEHIRLVRFGREARPVDLIGAFFGRGRD
jgi:hypothetical protein